MLNIDTFKKIYDILDQATPASYDCGTLCGSICCSDSSFDDGDSYIYLFPGEKEYLDSVGSNLLIEKQRRDEHDLPLSWGEYVYIARCPGKDSCERYTRPIQCRTFPLQPYITENGELEMRLCYTELPYSCPFVEGKTAVSEDFWRLTKKAWELLVMDKPIRDLVKQDSKDFLSSHDPFDHSPVTAPDK